MVFRWNDDARGISLHAIIDYNSVLPNTNLVYLDQTKRIGFDVLFTYMLHPGTTLHVGYTGNYENMRWDPSTSPLLQRTTFPDTSVGRQLFIKLRYLLHM